MNITEMFVCDVCVNLGGGDVCVAEHDLYGANIGAVTEEIRSKAVADDVGSNFFGNSRGDSIIFYDTFNRAGGEAICV